MEPPVRAAETVSSQATERDTGRSPRWRANPPLARRSRSPPPRLAPAGKSLLVGVLESAASNRRLRLGKVDQGAVTWGPALDQARDESLAFDLLASGSRAVAVWDDTTRDSDDGVIKLVSFDAATLAPSGSPRVVSPRGADTEMPRLAARPEDGVVDVDHRVFGVPNLYVVDGSTLPTQGSANPALTIMALAARAADRLIRLGRRGLTEQQLHAGAP